MGRGGQLCVFAPAWNSRWVLSSCGSRGAAGSNRDWPTQPLMGKTKYPDVSVLLPFMPSDPLAFIPLTQTSADAQLKRSALATPNYGCSSLCTPPGFSNPSSTACCLGSPQLATSSDSSHLNNRALNHVRLLLYAGAGWTGVSLLMFLLPSADDGTPWLTFMGCLRHCANVDDIKWGIYLVNFRCCRSRDLCNELL